ncbi:hypothetical protein Tco_0817163 [Tanacetum coccineum]
MSDSEHSTVTYTLVSEDDSDIGSSGVDGPPIMPEVPPSPDYIPGPEGPPSPDYVPGPEEPEHAPPSPIYIPFVPEPVYPEFLPVDDESPGYIPESDPEEDPEEDDEEDPEEDPADYPADRGDDDDGAEDEHLAPADPAAVAYSADRDPCVGPATARADLYGFANTLEATLGRRMSRELGYGIRDTWDDLVGAIQEIAQTTDICLIVY